MAWLRRVEAFLKKLQLPGAISHPTKVANRERRTFEKNSFDLAFKFVHNKNLKKSTSSSTCSRRVRAVGPSFLNSTPKLTHNELQGGRCSLLGR